MYCVPLYPTARVMRYHTEAVYEYSRVTYMVARFTSMRFKVQTCKDAIVGLFSNMAEKTAYEIVIGGSNNNVTGIRRERLEVRYQSFSIIPLFHSQ